MPRARTVHRCTGCRAVAAKWVGQCAVCGEWGSLVEEPADDRPSTRTPAGTAVPLAMVDATVSGRRPTGVPELDRVLGGGLVEGSVTLLGGEPGIGKSTLLLQVLAAVAASGPCLLVSAEESATQVRLRAERLGPLPGELLVLAETTLPSIITAIEASHPAVCVVDSIQAVADPDLGSGAGSVTQVRECAQALTRVAKERGPAVILVGHVTKDGGLAGPRTLEHIVDTVLSFEGDRYHALRMLRAVKHRFGTTGELGLFEMTDHGMEGVDDPGGLFVGDRSRDAPGSAVLMTVEGRRPLLVEVQALVGRASSTPRRAAQGVDAGRVAQLIAVLERHAGVGLTSADVFVSAAGGVRLAEPAADLGIALALVSAATCRPVPADVAVVGEVGLGGELRHVPHAGRRLAEAARMGFGRALVPVSSPAGPRGLETVRAGTIAEAVAVLGIASAGGGRAGPAGAGSRDGWGPQAPARRGSLRLGEGARRSSWSWPRPHPPARRRPF